MFMSGLLSNANIREAKTPMILACQIECHRPLQKLITNPEDELTALTNQEWSLDSKNVNIYIHADPKMYVHT